MIIEYINHLFWQIKHEIIERDGWQIAVIDSVAVSADGDNFVNLPCDTKEAQERVLAVLGSLESCPTEFKSVEA